MIAQELITKEFSTIGAAVIIDLVSDQISSLCKDMGQKLSQDDMSHVINAVRLSLSGKYKSWRVIDFANCLENGKIGNYTSGFGSSSKVTVANISSWMYQHNAKVMSGIIASNIKQQSAMRNDTVNMMSINKAGSEYGNAMAWKLDQYMMISNSYRKGTESYQRAFAKISALTLDMVVEAMKTNNTKQLITW